ncbi:hypothetical protein [Nocardia paucivorans]|uniref:hypothetical protein n=1 Tax=Nocardia paucivorans TaxID=114259 RepID=UPI0002E4B71C|nr:hypothetical protein [Nocardia paucivorans]
MFSAVRRVRVHLCAFAAAVLATGLTAALGPDAHASQSVTVHPGMEVRHTEYRDEEAIVSRCTIGLTGSVGNARYGVTAGHCYRSGIITDAKGNSVGWYESQRPDDGMKFGFALLRLYDNVGVSASMGKFGLSSVDTKPRVGQEVCKVGATTGWGCGKIIEVDDDYLYVDKSLGAEGGDSGAVVYRQTSDGHAAFVGILAAYDGDRDHAAVVEPAGRLFGQIRRYGPTRENPFVWYRV